MLRRWCYVASVTSRVLQGRVKSAQWVDVGDKEGEGDEAESTADKPQIFQAQDRIKRLENIFRVAQEHQDK